jgi:hypothetical protein
MCVVIKNFLSLLLLLSACESKIYNGKCPRAIENASVNCSNYNDFHDMQVLAAAEAPSTTFNFFHNPFASINCMRFSVSCGGSVDHLLSFSISCNFNEKSHFCFPIKLLKATRSSGAHGLQFDFLPGSQCDKSVVKGVWFDCPKINCPPFK